MHKRVIVVSLSVCLSVRLSVCLILKMTVFSHLKRAEVGDDFVTIREYHDTHEENIKLLIDSWKHQSQVNPNGYHLKDSGI